MKNKNYREGDEERTEGPAEKAAPITAVLLVMTDKGIDIVGDIQGMDVQRKASLQDVVTMASAAKAEAIIRMTSAHAADALLESLAMAQRAAMAAQSPMPTGVPIIGSNGRNG